jgi:hypothetical protein
MIPLVGPRPPSSHEELTVALKRGLGHIFDLPSGREIVSVEGGYPELQRLAIDVSHARARRDFKPRLQPAGRRDAGLFALQVHFVGRRVRVEHAALDFELTARGVHFHINHDDNQHFLDPVDAEHGHFQSHMSKADLESLMHTVAQEEVAKHNLTVERVELTLHDTRNTRMVTGEVRVTASTKMAFATLRAVVVGKGELAVDDELNLAIRGLTFDGEGLAGKMAAAVARTQLQPLDNLHFPMASVTIGRLRLHDVKLTCRDGIQIEAALGT